MDDASPPGLGWEDEEEPLFADDIRSDDDEDPPPLPPPMPPLSQLSQPHTTSNRTPSTMMGGGRGGGGGLWDGTQATTSAADGQGDGEQDTPTQKKRAPILTLTVDRIFSEKGLPRIEKEFPKLKFKGKGHEVTDLRYLIQQYEHWANSLYPKLTFKDVTDRIEKLATKKEFKSQLIQMRRRWARGPTPNDEEDDITRNHHENSSSVNDHHDNPSDNHHRDNSPSDRHHIPINGLHSSPDLPNIPGSSPTHTESESGMKESESGMKESDYRNDSDTDDTRLMNGSDVDCTNSGSCLVSIRADRKEECGEREDVIVSEGDSERDTSQTDVGGESERRDSQQSKEMKGGGFEDLLMRESDILREREETSRKRDRDSDSSPGGGKQNQSQQTTSCSNEVGEHTSVKAKKPKLTSEADKMMEELLAEEEQLMMEA